MAKKIHPPAALPPCRFLGILEERSKQ
jgi:hypothetical protein